MIGSHYVLVVKPKIEPVRAPAAAAVLRTAIFPKIARAGEREVRPVTTSAGDGFFDSQLRYDVLIPFRESPLFVVRWLSTTPRPDENLIHKPGPQSVYRS